MTRTSQPYQADVGSQNFAAPAFLSSRCEGYTRRSFRSIYPDEQRRLKIRFLVHPSSGTDDSVSTMAVRNDPRLTPNERQSGKPMTETPTPGPVLDETPIQVEKFYRQSRISYAIMNQVPTPRSDLVETRRAVPDTSTDATAGPSCPSCGQMPPRTSKRRAIPTPTLALPPMPALPAATTIGASICPVIQADLRPLASNPQQADVMGIAPAKNRKRPATDDFGQGQPRKKRPKKVKKENEATLANERFRQIFNTSTPVVRVSDLQKEAIDDYCLAALSKKIVVWLDEPKAERPKYLHIIEIKGQWRKVSFQRELYPPSLFPLARKVFDCVPIVLTFNKAQPCEFTYRETVQGWLANSSKQSLAKIAQFLIADAQAQPPRTAVRGPDSFRAISLLALLEFIKSKSCFNAVHFALHIRVFYRRTINLRQRFLQAIRPLSNVTVLCDTSAPCIYTRELKAMGFKVIEPAHPRKRLIEGFPISDEALEEFERAAGADAYRVLIISSGPGEKYSDFRIWECGADSSVVIGPLETIGDLLRDRARHEKARHQSEAEAMGGATNQTSGCPKSRSCSVEI